MNAAPRTLRAHLLRNAALLILVSTVLLASGSYLRLSQLAEREAAALAKSLSLQAVAAIEHWMQPSLQDLAPLASAARLRSGELSTWLERLPELVAMLEATPIAVAIYIGGPGGEYFTVRRLQGEQDAEHFRSLPGAVWTVQFQNAADQAISGQQLIHFDAALNELGRVPAQRPEAFDPRERPWYQIALLKQMPVLVEPYVFHSTGKRGISLARPAGEGWVVGLDIRLERLEQRLAEISSQNAAQLWLLDEQRLPIADDGVPVAGEDGLLRNLRHLAEGQAMEVPRGWQLYVAPLNLGLDAHIDVALAMALDEDGLIGPARAVRNDMLWMLAIVGVLMVLAAMRIARQLAAPAERLSAALHAVQRFDFTDSPVPRSKIREIDSLSSSFIALRRTLNQLLSLLDQVARQSDLDRLLPVMVEASREAADCEGARLYLCDADGQWQLRATDGKESRIDWLAAWQARGVVDDHSAVQLAQDGRHAQALPLLGRRGDLLGLLVLESGSALGTAHAEFARVLSGFSALALESRQLLAEQRALFDAFVRLIADAVDAKSPYTGGHCRRVPELTEMLVELAHESDAPAVRDFRLDEEQREAVHVAAWLHDCGKVVTPEYVVDKATKLETIHDRIHEIRTRFEVMKRDVEVGYWRGRAEGGDADTLAAARDAALAALDDDFSFVARCNLGGEAMSEADQARLREIAGRRWQRTLDNRLGISHEALDAHPDRDREVTLPVEETLLADRPEHRIPRPDGQAYAEDNPWGFRMPVPELLYDRGELKNLSIARGTLTEEERYKINEHIVQTIRLLTALPFPRHLRSVPEIAGGHHERMDSRGYPRAIPAGEMSIPARMMAIADVFEALTATDRPYKRGKTVDQALAIMDRMAADAHLDPELYALFRDSDLPGEFARRFLSAPAQPTAS